MVSIPKKTFDIDFIERTLSIIKEYKEKWDFTLLLNCLLGLIILPKEFAKNSSFQYLNVLIKDIPEIQSILDKDETIIFNPTKRSKSKRYKKPQKESWIPAKKTIGTLLTKIRNGLSHVDTIEPINNVNKNKWEAVIITDINQYNRNNTELKLKLNQRDILTLATYISTEYLKEKTEMNLNA